MENVSFLKTDISTVTFGKVNWGKDNRIVEERELEKSLKDSPESTLKDASGRKITLDSIKAVYRNLRENYEYRLRYDEAGKFFIREMELKRKYKESRQGSIIKTGFGRRHFSITGFYHLASYGEKIRMPAGLMAITILFSLLASLEYFHPGYYPSFDYKGLTPLANATERSFIIFLQLRNENFIWLDYIFKALGILS
jgi:hypothetical protein